MDANSVQDLKGSISLRALETGSGLRFFLDDDEESYFDLNLEGMADCSEEFEFQISFSPLPVAGVPTQYPSYEALGNGGVLPFQVVEARSLLVSNHEAQVYPEERLLAESCTPLMEDATGRENLKARFDPISEKVQCFDGDLQCMDEKKRHGAGGTRKASKMATKINNGMMFLINFPSEKIRSTFVSIVKSYSFLSLHPKRRQNEDKTQERGHRYKKLMMQFSSWLALVGKKSQNRSSKNTDTALQRASSLDIDEDFIRSIFDAVDYAVGRRSRGTASRKAPQESSFSPRTVQKEIEGAPLERNRSINSAIAHCKISYGNTDGLP